MLVFVESSGDTVLLDGRRCRVFRGHDDEGVPVALLVAVVTRDVLTLETALRWTQQESHPVNVEVFEAEDLRYGIPE